MLGPTVGVSSATAAGKRAGGERRRRDAPKREEKGVPVSNPLRKRLGKLRASEAKVMCAWVRPEEGHDGVSAVNAMASGMAQTFRCVHGVSWQTGARASFGERGGVSPWSAS